MTSAYFINLSFILVYCVLGCENSWIPTRSVRQVISEVSQQKEDDVKPEQLDDLREDNTITTGKEENPNSHFWLLRDDNTSQGNPEMKELVIQPSPADEMAESTTLNGTEEAGQMDQLSLMDDPQWQMEYGMDEVILLPRNNCNLEVQVNEWEDRKLKIEYEDLINGTSGECETTLRGRSGILLAVLVSDVRFNVGNDDKASREVLKVVSRSNNFNFTLREYHGREEYYPVILTDSDRVSLVLSYSGKDPLKARSSFNLEVFNYYKNENRINSPLQDESHNMYGNSSKDVDNIFITTAVP